jgi:hypothetical protein
MRRVLIATLGCLALSAVVMAPSAGAASARGCQLQGTASFSPGLSSTSSQTFSYGFSGTLSGCQSSESGLPSSGTVSAGQTLTEQVFNSLTGRTDTVTYQEPVPTGSGGCSNSTTEGSALVTWADGTYTVVSYSTTGALAAVSLSGTPILDMTLTAVNGQPGDPETYTITTTNTFQVYNTEVQGQLAFQPSEPTACTTSTGVTIAAISGTVSLVNYGH